MSIAALFFVPFFEPRTAGLAFQTLFEYPHDRLVLFFLWPVEELPVGNARVLETEIEF